MKDVDWLESIHGGAHRESCANYRLFCGCVSECFEICHDVLFQGHCPLNISDHIFSILETV